MKILKVIDIWGWAYEFVGREQARYSRHQIELCPIEDVTLARGDWDCIYIHGTDIGEKARSTLPLLAKSLGIPVIGGYGGYNEVKYEYCDAVCCIAPQSYEWTRDNYDCQVYFVTEGIDTEFWQPDQSRDYTRQLRVGWAGRPASLKRPELLSKLCKRVRMQSDRDPSHFVRNRDLTPMQEFYRQIDALILLSKTECMPRVLIEAMACGLPVITTDVGNVRAVVDDEWIITETEDTGIIWEANLRLTALDDANIRQVVGEMNRQVVEEEIAWSVLAPKWDAMFEEVACHHGCCTS